MRKGQTEILGFLVIVLLLLFVGIFFLYFSLRAEPETLQDSVVELQLNNLMNAVTQYSVCEDADLEDVMVACNDNRRICNEDSCSLMENELLAIFDELGLESDTFELKLGDFYTFGACSGEKIVASKPLKGFDMSISDCS